MSGWACPAGPLGSAGYTPTLRALQAAQAYLQQGFPPCTVKPLTPLNLAEKRILSRIRKYFLTL